MIRIAAQNRKVVTSPDFSTFPAPARSGTPLATGPCITSLQRKVERMWNWISCYVTGHDYSVSCDGGSIFLRCLVCGRRSQGWLVHRAHAHDPRPHA